MTNPHSADDSYLGYYYQGMYALVKLLEADDYDKVSIETADDVYLEGAEKRLYQLKHSLKVKGKLNVKNDGFWKTIRIWADLIRKSDMDEKTYFIFVTPLIIDESSSLKNLSISNSDKTEVVEELLFEAERVASERETARQMEEELPYKTRWPGCNAFMRLTANQKKELINRITIHPQNFNIKEINKEIKKRVKNTIPIAIRDSLVERLIEWWDRRVVLGILNEVEREISKIELTQKIHSLYTSFCEESLPDDFSYRDDEVDVEAEISGNMELQIDLVNGGNYRKRRAAIVRWQARNQREKWIDDDLLYSHDLNMFDKQLIRVWGDSFYPMKDDLEESPDSDLCKNGCALLDWSHKKAHLEIVPIRSNWKQPFLVQGSYQQLANELKVGWHPEYEEKFKRNSEE
ncbi:ABC-three component system protein [Bacillus cereus]|uniref:ABC-three component system protein n=1 Tax=Bacillus cereus TaxID=1396 RepID=UPI003B7EB597